MLKHIKKLFESFDEPEETLQLPIPDPRGAGTRLDPFTARGKPNPAFHPAHDTWYYDLDDNKLYHYNAAVGGWLLDEVSNQVNNLVQKVHDDLQAKFPIGTLVLVPDWSNAFGVISNIQAGSTGMFITANTAWTAQQNGTALCFEVSNHSEPVIVSTKNAAWAFLKMYDAQMDWNQHQGQINQDAAALHYQPKAAISWFLDQHRARIAEVIGYHELVQLEMAIDDNLAEARERAIQKITKDFLLP